MARKNNQETIANTKPPFDITVRDLVLAGPDNLIVDLSGQELKILPGERVAMTGLNGSGKTFVMNAMAGLGGLKDAKPSKGEVFYGDLPIYSLKSKGRTALRGALVGYVPQVVEPLCDHEPIAYNLRVTQDGLSNKINEAEIDRLVEYLGLKEILDRPASALSGGELQLANLISVLHPDPYILLLDEPMSALSPEMFPKVDSLLDERTDRGQIVVMIDHRSNPTAPRIVRFEQGRIVEDTGK